MALLLAAAGLCCGGAAMAEGVVRFRFVLPMTRLTGVALAAYVLRSLVALH